MSKWASRGGVILTGIGGAIACENIGNAETREEKNEIFVEFLGGALFATGAGAALGVMFAATPVGWVAALAIGGATIAAGWAAGKFGKKAYDHLLEEYDFVKMSGVDKWCS